METSFDASASRPTQKSLEQAFPGNSGPRVTFSGSIPYPLVLGYLLRDLYLDILLFSGTLRVDQSRIRVHKLHGNSHTATQISVHPLHDIMGQDEIIVNIVVSA